MLRNMIVGGVVAILWVALVGGCSKQSEPSAPPQEQTKSAAEYKAEAEKQITEQNMSQELAKIENEVNAEATADANQTE